MRIAEIDKLIARQDELAQLAAQEEAQRKAKEKADKDMYDKAIASADKDFADKQYKLAKVHYNEALIALPNEKYPRDQIAKCDELMEQEALEKMAALQKAQQDSIRKANDQRFDAAMSSAKTMAQNKQYEQAIQKYNEAASIKPDQRQAIQKLIDDLNNTIELLAKQEADYKRFIQSADGYFTQSKLNEALADYENALKIKPNEEYPQNQIKEIQNKLVVEQKYADVIARADKAFDSAEWIKAKSGYTEALSIKPNETYPANRLSEIKKKITESNLAALSKAMEEKSYNAAIEEAEKAFKNDQLTTAKLKFQEAHSIKPSEELPPRRIKEIEALLGKIQPSIGIKVFCIILSDQYLEFPLPWCDHFVVGLRRRGKVVGFVKSLLMKINMNLREPFVIEFQPLLRFHLCLPGPVAVKVKIIMIGSSSRPWFLVFPGLYFGVGHQWSHGIIPVHITVTPIRVNAGIQDYDGIF